MESEPKSRTLVVRWIDIQQTNDAGVSYRRDEKKKMLRHNQTMIVICLRIVIKRRISAREIGTRSVMIAAHWKGKRKDKQLGRLMTFFLRKNLELIEQRQTRTTGSWKQLIRKVKKAIWSKTENDEDAKW